MTEWNGFRGAARRLDDIDLPKPTIFRHRFSPHRQST